ncbi:hypothetical protein INH39_11010 [Massilia violaceinigra]|uniref:Uncharacterized protein n=1 Tax=Massilia violaceinigra TaxID=2045208 RepID=A0ABY4AD94_9BURK|nr:hypothetical protein [Massilia violaceinigra]UOD32145.1 hypothetical protein INH39_11010 [Massilia violaceinigra]
MAGTGFFDNAAQFQDVALLDIDADQSAAQAADREVRNARGEHPDKQGDDDGADE